MKNLMKNIFLENEFEEFFLEEASTDEHFFMVKQTDEFLGYYLILFTDNINSYFEKEYNEQYFDYIKGMKERYDEKMDKNLTMIICVKGDTKLQSSNYAKKVLEIEEDPYFFKKHVITYCSKTVEDFKKIMTNGKQVKDMIVQVVNDVSKFNNFKNDSLNLENIYNLCSKIMIKIPFISFEISNKPLANLEDKINQQLETGNLENYRTALLTAFDGTKFENSDQLNEFLKKLEGEVQ